VAEGLNQRVDRGRLILFRPGLSLRLESFWHDVDGTLDERCASVLRQIPHASFGRLEEHDQDLRRFGFRVRHSTAGCAAFHGIAIGSQGHVELNAELQQESEFELVLSVWRSLRESNAPVSNTRTRAVDLEPLELSLLKPR
jgi:hypothetical protein